MTFTGIILALLCVLRLRKKLNNELPRNLLFGQNIRKKQIICKWYEWNGKWDVFRDMTFRDTPVIAHVGYHPTIEHTKSSNEHSDF